MSSEDYDDDDVATVIAPARKVLGDNPFNTPLPAAGVPAVPSSRRSGPQPQPQPQLAPPQPLQLQPQFAPLPVAREPGTATRVTSVRLGAPLWVKLYLAVTSLLIAGGVATLVYLKTQGAW